MYRINRSRRYVDVHKRHKRKQSLSISNVKKAGNVFIQIWPPGGAFADRIHRKNHTMRSPFVKSAAFLSDLLLSSNQLHHCCRFFLVADNLL